MGQELVTQSFALAGALDKAGNIHKLDGGRGEFGRLEQMSQFFQPGIRDRDDAGVRIDGGKGITSYFRFTGGQGIEDGGLADVGQSDKAAAGGQIFFLPVPCSLFYHAVWLTPNTGDSGAAEGAFAFLELHFTYHIAPAGDDELTAVMAIGIFRGVFRDVTQIDILQTGFEGNFPGFFQGAHRGRIVLLHFVERVKSGKMQWRQGAQFIPDPGTHFFQIFGIVVELGDHQIDDLEVDTLLPKNFQTFLGPKLGLRPPFPYKNYR